MSGEMRNVMSTDVIKAGDEALAALKREFGYEPDPHGGEQWIVWRGQCLVVAHPERLIRVYDRGCNGNFREIQPHWL